MNLVKFTHGSMYFHTVKLFVNIGQLDKYIFVYMLYIKYIRVVI